MSTKTIVLMAIASFFFTAASPCLSRTVYVWAGGGHSGDHGSWATAANDIQSAVNSLEGVVEDNTVLIAPGTYSVSGSGQSIVSLDSTLVADSTKLTIRGNLRAAELPPGVEPGETLLDGGKVNNGIGVEFSNSTVASEIARTLVLDGLAIRDCRADRGAGVGFTYQTSRGTWVEIRNCSFTDNVAEDRGGGFYAHLGGVGFPGFVVENSEFSGNEALNGGGDFPRLQQRGNNYSKQRFPREQGRLPEPRLSIHGGGDLRPRLFE